MANIVTDRKGIKRHYNDNGWFAREDGPTIDYPNGYKRWRGVWREIWPVLK